MPKRIKFSEPKFEFSHYYKLNDLDVIAFRTFAKQFVLSCVETGICLEFADVVYNLYNQLRYGTQYRHKNSSRIDNDA